MVSCKMVVMPRARFEGPKVPSVLLCCRVAARREGGRPPASSPTLGPLLSEAALRTNSDLCLHTSEHSTHSHAHSVSIDAA